ncbi:MAG: type II secretion system protein [Actinomycetota bacterium]
MSSRSDPREGGFTLVEVMVTLMIMSIITTAVLGVAMRAFKDTSIISNRRDVLGDGQIALQRLTKDLRQGVSVDAGTSTASRIDVDTYIDGDPHDISWRVQGGSAPYTLVRAVDGGTAVPQLSQLASDQVFTYPDDLSVDISLDLDTHTQDVPIQADVFLRNATTT